MLALLTLSVALFFTTDYTHCAPQSSNLAEIIIWSGRQLRLKEGTEYLANQHCPDTCSITFNTSRAATAAAVVFLRSSDEMPVPAVRKPWQYYVFYSLESPAIRKITQHENSFFYNLTMSYRRDSDIYLGLNYQKRDVPFSLDLSTTLIRTKKKAIAWFVSHCSTANRREEYVKKLQRYIQIDIYGRCGKFNCPHEHECYHMLQREYYFYLSFENNNCEDYITEKLYRILQHNVVPVVMGGSNYDAIVPPKSVINIKDFASTKALAEHLHKLMANPDMYLEHFAWKNLYRKVNAHLGLCYLCSLLYKRPKLRKTYANLNYWWNYVGVCRPMKWVNIP